MEDGSGENSRRLRWLCATKTAAEITMTAASLVWAFYWFVSPDPMSGDKYVDAWVGYHSRSRFFRTDGRQGVALIFQTLPWVVVVALSFAVMELRARIRRCRGGRRQRCPKMEKGWRMGTYPVWLWGNNWSPFVGSRVVITAAEAMGMVGIVLLLAYNFGRSTHNGFARIDAAMATMGGAAGGGHMMSSSGTSILWMKVRRAAFYCGTVSMVPFSLLWVPVSRGSPLLRLLRIPFERAVRYHVWLAVLTIALLSLHSLGYIAYYIATHQPHKILEWNSEQEKCSVVAGLVAWILGLVIAFSSLHFFRRRLYDTFFALHHLYLPFALFWLYHAIWTYPFFIVPLLLFFLDRFIRAVQSRRLVHIVSAKLLHSGALQLTLAVADLYDNYDRHPPQGHSLLYNALSTWCIRIPSISSQQWHFFSGASSPLEDRKELRIIVKPLGDWTKRLCSEVNGKIISDFAAAANSRNNFIRCPFSFVANVEGPYGDESDFYLKYTSLVLIAGGIGATPLLAILGDILHRYKQKQQLLEFVVDGKPPTDEVQPCLPTSIELYHCIRNPEELCLLDTVHPHRILPGYETLGLTITVHVYVTCKEVVDHAGMVTEAPDGMMELSKFRRRSRSSTTTNETQTTSSLSPETMLFFSPSAATDGKIMEQYAQGIIGSMSTAGRTQYWMAFTTLSSLLGYFVLSGIANTFIIKSYDRHTFPNYNRAHVVVACMALAVLVFGGIFVWPWFHRAGARNSASKRLASASVQPRSHDQSPAASPISDMDGDEEDIMGLEAAAGTSPWSGDVHVGGRPVWTDIFRGLKERNGGKCVGVLVSGSESLQGDVATECRRNSSWCLDTSSSTESSDGGKMNVVFHYHSVSFSF